MITFQGQPMTLKGAQLKVGDKFPEFTAVDMELNAVSLSDTKGVRVFLSVPSVDTGVCSIELSKFMTFFKEIDNATCYSISMDLPFALHRWCQVNDNKNVKTLSDYKTQSFGKATGTVVEELNLLTRAVFVVDADNVIRHVEYVSEIASEPNYQDVLTKIGELTK